MNRIFGGSSLLLRNFVVGMKYGFVVGALIGFFPGLYMTIKYKKISMIFASIFASAMGFAFFASIGSIVRSKEK